MGFVKLSKVALKVGLILFLIVQSVYPQSQENQLTACELEALLKELVNPDEEYLLHSSALRNQLKNLLNNYDMDNYQTIDDDLTDEEKRSLSSIARNGLLNNGKRNIAALARMNMLRQPADEIKRSIATLAKNGQLPSKEPETDETPASQWTMEKRNIGALARSGLLGGGKRNIASLARNDYDFSPYGGKRNLASLVRMGMNPSYTPKRNIASLARSNLIPYFGETKKNVGALARDWSLPKSSSKVNAKRETHQNQNNKQDKRNIQSFKSSQVPPAKVKRDIQYDSNDEILEPVYQPAPIDYEKYNEVMSELYPYYDNEIHDDKRFLGSVVRDGWSMYRPMGKRNIGSIARMGLLRSDPNNGYMMRQYRQQEQKRHIGALARSDFTPYKSDFASQSPAFVSDVGNQYIQAAQVGVDPMYNHIITHPVQPHYIKEVSVDHSIRPEIFTDLQNLNSINDNNKNFQSEPSQSIDNFEQEYFWNNEWECKIRVSKLLQILNSIINKTSDNNYLPYINEV